MNTRPCLWFVENNGFCPYGSECKFRHDFKSITCRFFIRGRCDFGSECRYFHPNFSKSNSSSNSNSNSNRDPNPNFKSSSSNLPDLNLNSAAKLDPAENGRNSEIAKNSEISYLKRRFAGKLKEIGEGSFLMEFEPSDPDWVKQL